MKVVILCGGQGTRIREVSDNHIPKPMVPVGNRPILWHIMKIYGSYGLKDFVLCLGHLGWTIKEFFINYDTMTNDFTIELGRNLKIEHQNRNPEEGWRISLVDTGERTETGARVRRVAHHLDEEDFMLTYGDGVSDVDLAELLKFHRSHGKMLTLTGVVPPGRFGEMAIESQRITAFREKPRSTGGYINGGFMVIRRAFIDRYLSDDDNSLNLERVPFQRAAADGEMMMFPHDGFWQCMDNYRDWTLLNELWNSGNAPWKRWE